MGVSVDLIFKMAAIGILLAIIHKILDKAGKEDWAFLANLVGVILALTIIVKEIDKLFETVKTMFNLY